MSFFNDLAADVNNKEFMESIGKPISLPPIPNGWYECELNDIVTKDNGEGKEYVEITYIVIEGQYAKRRVSERMYTAGVKPGAIEMTRKKLGTIIKFTGTVFNESLGLEGLYAELKGKLLDVNFVVNEYEFNGEKRTKNQVNYSDYKKAGTMSKTKAPVAPAVQDDSLPF